MAGEEGRPGGAETDIRSLQYWSQAAFYILLVAAALWVYIGAYKLFVGLSWIERDSSSGSTQAASDIAWAFIYFATAVLAFLLARWVQNDISSVFASRRFQVPREKLLVYGILGLPAGFVAAGVLLMLCNVKLSRPEFLPSHAEAYPATMPYAALPMEEALRAERAMMGEVTPREEEPAPTTVPGFEAMPVTEEEAMPAPAFFEAAPPQAAPAVPVGPPTGPAPEAPPSPPIAPAAPVAAYVEELPEEVAPEEEVPEAPPPTAPPVEAVVEAYVEEVPEEEPGFELVIEGDEEGDDAFELVEVEAPPEEPAEERPRSTKEAHEQLLGRLLQK